MYIPQHFVIKDETTVYKVIEEHSFATLVSVHNCVPYATHLPLVLNEEKTCLYGHFARQNTQWQDIQKQKVLAIFHGPHHYISSSWYETNQAVPTWNYVAVHVYGEVELIDDEQELASSLRDLVLKYEAPDSPYRLEDVDAEYLRGMYKGVQGFKLKIEKIEGKAKLSQNHPPHRQELVIKQLEQLPDTDSQQVAAWMRENLKK